jgi:hypothetical protein
MLTRATLLAQRVEHLCLFSSPTHSLRCGKGPIRIGNPGIPRNPTGCLAGPVFAWWLCAWDLLDRGSTLVVPGLPHRGQLCGRHRRG